MPTGRGGGLAPWSTSATPQDVQPRGGRNPRARAPGERQAQRPAYPGVQPILLELEGDEAFQLVLRAVQALGWKISEDNVDMAAHEVPATDAEASESGMDTKIVQFPRRLRA